MEYMINCFVPWGQQNMRHLYFSRALCLLVLTVRAPRGVPVDAPLPSVFFVCFCDWKHNRVAQVLAYDIECTKAPLKFPNVEIDQVQ